MSINITVESFEELKDLARQILGAGGEKPAVAPVQPAPRAVQPPVQQAAPRPVAMPQTFQAPAPQPVQQPVQTTQPTQPVMQPAPTPVQTTQPSYSLDDLGRAGMALMDSGRQAELQQLLVQFGVDALPSLPTAQYGAFATALRGLGAPI